MAFNEEKGMELCNLWFTYLMTGDPQATAENLFIRLHECEEGDDGGFDA